MTTGGPITKQTIMGKKRLAPSDYIYPIRHELLEKWSDEIKAALPEGIPPDSVAHLMFILTQMVMGSRE